MPRSCSHFRLLDRRVRQLVTKLLSRQHKSEQADPALFNPDLDRLAAFRLLVHAEIEDFLENKALEKLNELETSIASGSACMRQAPGLFGLSVILGRTAPGGEFSDMSSIVSYAKDIIAESKRRIRENNGIKSPSFVFLLLCAGKAIDEIDGVLSSSLNSYGKDRGDVAHKSVTRSATLRAPSVEISAARVIVKQLGTYFDIKR